jgi:Tetrapyrrole (Corrin/Porphyrin) Methylases
MAAMSHRRTPATAQNGGGTFHVPRAGRLTVVGAGYRLGHVTLEGLEAMRVATKLFHTGFETWLKHWFPHIESANTFQNGSSHRCNRYEDICDQLMTCVRQGHDVVWAVYGSASVMVTASRNAIRRARQEGFEARVLPGISAPESLWADVLVPNRFPSASWCGCTVATAEDYLRAPWRFDASMRLVLMMLNTIGCIGDVLDPT